MTVDDDGFEVQTEPSTFEDVRTAIEKAGIAMESAEVSKIPENTVKVSGEDAFKVLRLMETLDELDDTQNVFGNFDISDEDVAAYEQQRR